MDLIDDEEVEVGLEAAKSWITSLEFFSKAKLSQSGVAVLELLLES